MKTSMPTTGGTTQMAPILPPWLTAWPLLWRITTSSPRPLLVRLSPLASWTRLLDLGRYSLEPTWNHACGPDGNALPVANLGSRQMVWVRVFGTCWLGHAKPLVLSKLPVDSRPAWSLNKLKVPPMYKAAAKLTSQAQRVRKRISKLTMVVRQPVEHVATASRY